MRRRVKILVSHLRPVWTRLYYVAMQDIANETKVCKSVYHAITKASGAVMSDLEQGVLRLNHNISRARGVHE